MCLPHGVQNVSVLTNPEQLIWDSNSVHIGVFSVVEVGVWPPNPFQHLDRK